MEDDFVLIYAVNASFIAADLYLAPKSRLADGVMWLMIIRKGISKASMFAALQALEQGKAEGACLSIQERGWRRRSQIDTTYTRRHICLAYAKTDSPPEEQSSALNPTPM